jgi:hypothetical protein
MPCKCHVSPMLDAQPPSKWQPLARKIRNAEQNRLFPHFCCHHAGESVNKTDPRKEKDVVARDKVLPTSVLRRHTSAVSRSRPQSAKQDQRPDESDSRLQPGQASSSIREEATKIPDRTPSTCKKYAHSELCGRSIGETGSSTKIRAVICSIRPR